MKVLTLTVRICFSLVLFATGLSDFWDRTIDYAGAHGVPLPYLIIPLSGVFAILSALSILSGFKARAGAWLAILFVLPVAFVTNKFWLASDPLQMVLLADDFIKDLLMLGAAFAFAYFGAGQLSFDAMAMNATSSEPEKVTFTYDKFLNGYNNEVLCNDHSL
jgi:putative oxidoreductase